MAFTTLFGLVFVAGLILSVRMQKGPARLLVRLGTAAIPLTVAVVVAFGAFFFKVGPEPPSLTQLEQDFPSRRVDLEMLLEMSDADSSFSRIAPGFVYLNFDGPFRRDVTDDSKARLAVERWNSYRKIFGRTGVKLGIDRDRSRDMFVMVDSTGLLNRGHVSGYVHCVPPVQLRNDDRFYACMTGQQRGERKYNPETRSPGYSFLKLDDRWYAYDEGPS
jgi:hypothetical protein